MHLAVQPAYLTTYNRNLTADINELVMLMLAKDPGRRPATMKDVAGRMQRIRFYIDPPEEPPPQEPRR
jgi:hypothetical protein